MSKDKIWNDELIRIMTFKASAIDEALVINSEEKYGKGKADRLDATHESPQRNMLNDY